PPRATPPGRAPPPTRPQDPRSLGLPPPAPPPKRTPRRPAPREKETFLDGVLRGRGINGFVHLTFSAHLPQETRERHMYVQLNSVIIDSDTTNRQELATFLGQFGINPMAQLSSPEQLQGMLSRGDAPQLVIVNLDPDAHDSLKKIGKLPREYPNIAFFAM